MRLETLVKQHCPKCIECDDWVLADFDEDEETFEVECAYCGYHLLFKVKIEKQEEFDPFIGLEKKEVKA